jgi:hypothetical protein
MIFKIGLGKGGRKGRLWELFSGPFPPHPTRRFKAPGAKRARVSFKPPRYRGSRFRHTPRPLPSPPLPSRPILAPQALFPKWTSLDLLCGPWLAVYIGCCAYLAFGLPSFSSSSLSLGVYSLFSRIHVWIPQDSNDGEVGSGAVEGASYLDRA